MLRGDYEISPSHSFTGTFHQFRLDVPNSVFNDVDAVFPGLPGAGQSSKRRLGSFSLSSLLKPNVTNEARVGYQTSSPRFFTNETFPQGYVLSLGGGFSNPIQDFLDQGRDTRNVDIMDHISWVKGNHTVKVGGSVRLTQVDQFNDGGTVPTYTLGFGPGNPDPLVPRYFPRRDRFQRAGRRLRTLGNTGRICRQRRSDVQCLLALFGLRRRGFQHQPAQAELRQFLPGRHLADHPVSEPEPGFPLGISLGAGRGQGSGSVAGGRLASGAGPGRRGGTWPAPPTEDPFTPATATTSLPTSALPFSPGPGTGPSYGPATASTTWSTTA